MTAPLLIAMPGNEHLAAQLASALGFDLGHIETRQFPDGETYLRFITNPDGRSIALVCTLDHPNDKMLPLIFSAATARELRASKVGLISPYLAYMRQDRRFKPGEAVTSQQVARPLSEAFDWLSGSAAPRGSNRANLRLEEPAFRMRYGFDMTVQRSEAASSPIGLARMLPVLRSLVRCGTLLEVTMRAPASSRRASEPSANRP